MRRDIRILRVILVKVRPLCLKEEEADLLEGVVDLVAEADLGVEEEEGVSP